MTLFFQLLPSGHIWPKRGGSFCWSLLFHRRHGFLRTVIWCLSHNASTDRGCLFFCPNFISVMRGLNPAVTGVCRMAWSRRHMMNSWSSGSTFSINRLYSLFFLMLGLYQAESRVSTCRSLFQDFDIFCSEACQVGLRQIVHGPNRGRLSIMQ